MLLLSAVMLFLAIDSAWRENTDKAWRITHKHALSGIAHSHTMPSRPPPPTRLRPPTVRQSALDALALATGRPQMIPASLFVCTAAIIWAMHMDVVDARDDQLRLETE
jgi:hypothetical protein